MNPKSRILRGLNQNQSEAVTHEGGPLLVLAGAGSGKTRVLTHRIAYLIHHREFKPWEILSLTFTNKAAGEMSERLSGLLGALPTDLWMGTFHSICARILRREERYISRSGRFSIFDTQDTKNLLKEILKRAHVDQKALTPGRLRAAISRAKNRMEEVPVLFESGFSAGLAADLYESYQRELARNDAYDFDDLLTEVVRLFGEHPGVLKRYQKRFQHLLIDEYQDTNRAQYLIARSLVAGHRNITVVGDDDQSIYAFRGAEIRNILDFQDDFPDARTVVLEQNYRSTPDILTAACEMVSFNKDRNLKKLWTERPAGERISLSEAENPQDEAETIVSLFAENYPTRLGECVVLYRTNAQSRILEEVCRAGGQPYRIIGGLRFYERKEVKDVLAYLRLCLSDRDDVSFKRIVNFPVRGIGRQTQDRLEAFARQRDLSLLGAIEDYAAEAGRTAARLSAFTGLITALRSLVETTPVDEFLALVLKKSGLLEFYRREAADGPGSRLENIEELVSGARDYIHRTGDTTVRGFSEEVALLSDMDSWDREGGSINLMTLHNAKGLEFPVVAVVGLEEGLLPHQNALSDDEREEERRLFYVGMTRAMDKLYLSYCRFRDSWTGPGYRLPSRFLNDIPQESLELLVPSIAKPFEPDEQPAYDDETFRIGETVYHDRFGRGEVLEISGRGEKAIVTVKFNRIGIKRLLPRYADLKQVNRSP